MGIEGPEQDYPFISVVVCTFNRSQRLRCCLQSLTEQTIDSSRFEVIVVNNNSTDNTSQVVEQFTVNQPHFRLVSEKQQGLSHARNSGCREALGTYVAYIDDDAEASPDWVGEIVQFVERHSDIAMFGGPYAALVVDPVPAWFPLECGAMDLGPEEKPVDLQTEFIAGTNMIIRKDLLVSSGGFSPDLGMVGAKVFYGEETKLQLHFRTMAFDVYYVPRIQVRHYLSPDKMSLAWLLRAAYAVGRCSTLVYDRKRGLAGHLAGICYGCVQALKSISKYREIPLRRLLFYGLSPLASEIGAFSDFFLRHVRIYNRNS